MADFGPAWLERFRSGDAAAFDELFRAFAPRLFGYLFRITQHRELAQDLLQETWVRVATHAAGLRNDTRIGPWLYTIARNLAVSHHRSRRLEGERLVELSLADVRSTGTTPLEHTVAGQTASALEAALAKLPFHYREVLVLVAVEGLAPAEAAQVLGMKPAAVRKRLERARDSLATALDSDSLDRQTARRSSR